MRRLLTRPLPALLLLACLPLTSCSQGSTTASKKPTSVPAITVAECGKLLSISEANRITRPVMPTTLIDAQVGTCGYQSSAALNFVLAFRPYTRGSVNQIARATPIPALKGYRAQVQITSSQPVSGIGDQALFVLSNNSAIHPRI